MNKLELIIFDLDGTLVDIEIIYRKGWAHVLKAYGHDLDESDFEVMRGNSTTYNNGIIKTYLGSDELVQEARQRREDYFFTVLENGEMKLKKGAREILQAAKEQGLKLGVATSSYRERGMAMLKSLDLIDYFDYLVFGDEVTHSKPHPEIYQSVLKEARVSPDNAIVVEDSVPGMRSALAAGLRTFLVPESEVDLAEIEGEYTVHEDLEDVMDAIWDN
ncbi:HAD family hydrolase [Aerococcaceae bacterium WGS1372]